MPTSFLSPTTVCQRTSLSRSTLDRLVSAGQFVKPIRISERRLAFREDEVTAWMASRIEQRAVA